jgi:hypothetical protein
MTEQHGSAGTHSHRGPTVAAPVPSAPGMRARGVGVSGALSGRVSSAEPRPSRKGHPRDVPFVRFRGLQRAPTGAMVGFGTIRDGGQLLRSLAREVALLTALRALRPLAAAVRALQPLARLAPFASW